MNQGRSLSSENAGYGTTGARSMKNVDLARSGCICLILSLEGGREPTLLPQLWTTSALCCAPIAMLVYLVS